MSKNVYFICFFKTLIAKNLFEVSNLQRSFLNPSHPNHPTDRPTQMWPICAISLLDLTTVLDQLAINYGIDRVEILYNLMLIANSTEAAKRKFFFVMANFFCASTDDKIRKRKHCFFFCLFFFFFLQLVLFEEELSITTYYFVFIAFVFSGNMLSIYQHRYRIPEVFFSFRDFQAFWILTFR